MSIVVTSVLVDDQDKALRFYTDVLGFVKKYDAPRGAHRWRTVVIPDEPDGVELAREPDEHPAIRRFKRALVEDGIPFTSFGVKDVNAEYNRLMGAGVRFTQPPVDMGPVTTAVFDDTGGNLIQIAQLKSCDRGSIRCTFNAKPRSCKMNRLGISLAALLCAVGFAASVGSGALADEKAKEPPLDAPQPEHKILERFAGEWRFEKLGAPEDGSKPESLGTGTISAELVGGFFVVARWSGKLYGTEYKAIQSLGYDIKQKKYTGCWIDSTMSYRWELSGAVDEKSQELTITASGPGPTGGTCTFRERYQFNSAASITIIGEMRKGEKWVTFLTTRLTRKR